MAILGPLVEWTKETLGPFGEPGLAVIAFTEAIINPIPPDPLLAILAVDQSLWYALYLGLFTAFWSVAGAAVGYWIGGRFSPWVHRKFAGPRMDKVEGWYKEHGEWIVAIAAVTPIPFKIFTVSSGLFHLRFWHFLAAAAVGRSLRFVPEALLSARYGEQAIVWLDQGGLVILLVLGLAGGAYYLWAKRRRDQRGIEESR